MKIGFTAAQAGISPPQQIVLRQELKRHVAADRPVPWFVHGKCTGGDEQGARIARQVGFKLEAFPSDREDKTAEIWSEVEHPCKPPLDRNPDIVLAADRMYACPDGFKEKQRSGTWATIRCARRQGVRLTIIWPDGSVSQEN